MQDKDHLFCKLEDNYCLDKTVSFPFTVMIFNVRESRSQERINISY